MSITVFLLHLFWSQITPLTHLFQLPIGGRYIIKDGIPQLNNWLRELQILQHSPPRAFGLAIGTGSQDLVTKGLQMLISPGDNILFESPGYVGVIAFLRHQPCHLVGKALSFL